MINMKGFEECLNPKCKKLSEATETHISMVCASCDQLVSGLEKLTESLQEEHAFDYDGIVRLEKMAMRARKLLNETGDLYNMMYEKDLL